MALDDFLARFGITVPVVLAPMSGIAGGALAAAVCRGGGLGLIGHSEGLKLDEEVAIARVALGLGTDDAFPVGFGILGFQIDSPDGKKAEAYLRQLVRLRPKAIWLCFGTQIEQQVQLIRKIEKELSSARILILIQVGTAEYGKKVAEWDVDAIVAQGTEAGGHGNSHATGLPLLSLLPPLASHLSILPHPPILLAAGGLSTPAHFLSVRPYALGIIMGTAFLASPESLYSPAHKKKLLLAKNEDAKRGLIFDRINGWDVLFGEEIDGRALVNETTKDEDDGVELNELREKYEKAKGNDPEMERLVVWAGSGVGLLTEVVPAEAIVRAFGAGIADRLPA
ncbi:nitronate monooxygenase, partial [Phenoliferia sp. Uapishka_3]